MVVPSQCAERTVGSQSELGNDACAILIPAAEWLVVHLVRLDRAREMILLKECRGRWIQQCIYMADGLVRARALLQVD